MYADRLIKIAPSYDEFQTTDIFSSDVLPTVTQDLPSLDPMMSPAYMADPLPPVFQEQIPAPAPSVMPQDPGAYAPMPVLMETPEVTAVQTPDGGAVVELKDPADPAENRKKLLILGGAALALYFLLK